jgi:uncharacterized membrane protein
MDHPPAIQAYLILFTVASILLTTRQEGGWLRFVALLGAYAPLFAYLDTPRGPSWLWPHLVTAPAVAGMHLMTVVNRAQDRSRRLDNGDLFVMHAAVIGLYGLLSEMLQSRNPDGPAIAAAGLAVLSAGLVFALARQHALAALNAAGLSFTLLAIALADRFDGPVVVIGWAVEGAVVAWLGVRASIAVFRFGGLALWVLAAGRLADSYSATEPTSLALLNARTAVTAVVVVLGYLLARQWRHHEIARKAERIVPVMLHVAASGLTLLWMSAEIDGYWRSGRGQPQAELSKELTRSLAWGAYGAALVAAGMWRALVSIRWIGIAVIGLTVLKVVVVDLSELGGIYRVVGFMVVGALLVAVSYLYQQRRGARPPRGTAAGNAPQPPGHTM